LPPGNVGVDCDWRRHELGGMGGRSSRRTGGSTGLPIVRIQNLNNSSAPFNYCSFEVAPKFHLKPGDFLISWSGTPGTSFGAFIWEGPPGILNQHIFRAELFGGIYNPKFLACSHQRPPRRNDRRAHGGVGLQHITKGELESMLIPYLHSPSRSASWRRSIISWPCVTTWRPSKTKKRDLATQSTYSAVTALASAERGAELSSRGGGWPPASKRSSQRPTM